jgi:DNA-binding SARP family transcriptional activator
MTDFSFTLLESPRWSDYALLDSGDGLKLDPYLEALHCILMRAYAAQGDQNSVRRQYQACQTSLADLGFSPSPETQELYQRLMG